jgi:hypothetical protein
MNSPFVSLSPPPATPAREALGLDPRPARKKGRVMIIKTNDLGRKPRPSPLEPEPTWVQLPLPGIDPA